MRKPAFCICENKEADQLRSNREADQRLCFPYEGVSKSSYTNAITFLWYKIPYQTFFHVLNRYVSSSGAKFQQVASKYNKFMKL